MPMKNPPHPGRSIRINCLEPAGLSVAAGAKVLGVGRMALSRVVKGEAGVTADLAIRLAHAFGATPEVWMRMQSQYDRREADNRIGGE